MLRRLSRPILIIVTLLFSIEGLALSNSYVRSRSATNSKKFKSHNEYSYKACEEFNTQEDSYNYNVVCIEGEEKLYTMDKLKELESSMERLTYRTYQNYMLDTLQNNALNQVKDNRSAAKTIIRCTKSKTQQCMDVMKRIKAVIKVQLPELRKNMAVMNSHSSILKKIDPKIEHDDHTHFFGLIGEEIGVPVGPLNEQEIDSANKSYDEFRKVAKDNVYSTSKCLKIENGKYISVQTQSCRRSNRGGIGTRNKIHKKVKEISRSKYETIMSNSPFLGFISTHPDDLDTDETLNDQIAKAFEKLDERMKVKEDDLKSLRGNDRIELLAYTNQVEDLLSDYGQGKKVLCDATQELKNRLDLNENIKTVGMIGASIAGAAFCGLTAGLGCAVGAAVLTEAAFLTDAQLKYNKAMNDYASGLTGLEELEAAHSERNISVLAAPTSLIGTGVFKAGSQFVKEANHTKKFTGQTRTRSEYDRRGDRIENSPRRKGERRHDDEMRTAIDDIKADLGDSKLRMMQEKYNPGNIHGLENADQIFLAGVAHQIEKQAIRNNKLLTPEELEVIVKKDLREIIDECKGVKK